MTRRSYRMNKGDTPAIAREARAKQTKQDIADELKRLSAEAYKKAQQADWERVQAALEAQAGGEGEEEARNDYSHLLAGGTVAADSLLGANRKKTPGIQGRPPWA